ncbi:14760_t:CDS:2 [Rhizophagus irregularis]|nr:14760_t:CDS:2 [Rhizophagus irregularis]
MVLIEGRKCLGAPDNAKSKKNINSQGSTTSTIYIPTITPNTTYTNIPIKNFVDRISEEEQDDLEIQLAQALFSAGVPFAFVENLLVIQFFKCLRLSFKLPNRRKLAGDLLNDIYDEVKLQTDEQISKAKTLCMVSDGCDD